MDLSITILFKIDSKISHFGKKVEMSELIQFLERIQEKIKSAITIFSVVVEDKENILNCKWHICFSKVQICLLLAAGLKNWGTQKISLGLFENSHTVISCVDVLLFQQNIYSLKY